MVQPLKILFAAAEVAPLMKTGGLADVAYALPKMLCEMGHDVRVAMPCYRGVPLEDRGVPVASCEAHLGGGVVRGALRESILPGTDVPLYLIEHEQFFDRERPYDSGGGEYQDNVARFSFFSRALLNGVRATGWRPDVVHCNDWHTALMPAYLKTHLAHDAFWGGTPSLFTIHNLMYQGRYPAWLLPDTGLGWELFTPEYLEFYGDINLMKTGIAFADKVNTVSRRYAKEIQSEEFGHGLDGLLRHRSSDLSGILNGVDYSEWNPANDKHLPKFFDAEHLDARGACKEKLQEEFGLPKRDVPLFGMATRLVWQKGLDIVAEALPKLLQRDIQIALLGTGDAVFEQFFSDLASRFPAKFGARIQYDAGIAHRIHGGADFYLMPSHFEPSGLSQLYSLAYGSVPIVRKTGGLGDSIRDCTRANIDKGRATGIVFSAPSADDFTRAITRAERLYENRDQFRRVQIAGMGQDFSWTRSADHYVRLYRQIVKGAEG